jgi:phage terminase large subunit-like protein
MGQACLSPDQPLSIPAMTKLTEEQRIDVVAALVAAMVKQGHIFEDQMLQARDDLMAADDEELRETCEELGVDAWPVAKN